MFIEYAKMSKKEKKEFDKKRRNFFECNPVTKKTKNKKAYDRKKKDKEDE